MSAELSSSPRPSLGQETYINLATFRKNGIEVRTPVWVAEHDGLLLVFSKANSGKMKRIKNNPKVKIAACSMQGKVSGEWYDAIAEITTDPETIEKLYQGFNKKYGWQMRFGSWYTKVRGTFNDRGYLILRLA